MEEKVVKIVSWNPDRGFGFAMVDGRRVFVHANVFSSRGGERGDLLSKGDDLTGLEASVVVNWENPRGPSASRARLTEQSSQKLLQRNLRKDVCFKIAGRLAWEAWALAHPGSRGGYQGTRVAVQRAIEAARNLPEGYERFAYGMGQAESGSLLEWIAEEITALAEKAAGELEPWGCQCGRCRRRWQEAAGRIPFTPPPSGSVNDRAAWNRQVFESLGTDQPGDVGRQWNEK